MLDFYILANKPGRINEILSRWIIVISFGTHKMAAAEMIISNETKLGKVENDRIYLFFFPVPLCLFLILLSFHSSLEVFCHIYICRDDHNANTGVPSMRNALMFPLRLLRNLTFSNTNSH